jgi:hypothetical protein
MLISIFATTAGFTFHPPPQDTAAPMRMIRSFACAHIP